MSEFISRIICLANSRKMSGRCLAGIEWKHDKVGSWIRPVSDRPNAEISMEDRRYENGVDPQLLDIIDIPMQKRVPHNHQSENCLINAQFYWTKVGTFDRSSLDKLVSPVEPLWLNGHSSSNGRNDQVPEDRLDDIRDSLVLIEVPNVIYNVYAPGATFNNPKRRVQCRFTHCNETYELWVTDPQIEHQYLAMHNGTYKSGSSYLTISLGEPYEGFAYKLVAGVIGGD